MNKWIISSYSTLLSIGFWIGVVVQTIFYTVGISILAQNAFVRILGFLVSAGVSFLLSAITFGLFFVIIDIRNTLRAMERSGTNLQVR